MLSVTIPFLVQIQINEKLWLHGCRFSVGDVQYFCIIVVNYDALFYLETLLDTVSREQLQSRNHSIESGV